MDTNPEVPDIQKNQTPFRFALAASSAVILVLVFIFKSWSLLHQQFWWMIVAALVGFFVGLSELINRYNSFRFIFASLYSWLYVLINLAAGMLVFLIMQVYNINLGTIGTHPLGKSLAAGLGAMAFMRSSFFSFKDSGGKTVDIGPAVVLNIFLKASERQFDQMVAGRTLSEIGEIMRGLNFVSASKDLPILILKSMLVLSVEEQAKLSEEIGKLLQDESSGNDIRNVTLGIIIARYSGIDLLSQAVYNLRKMYESAKPVIDIENVNL
jgi:hypothetical protein